MKRLTVILITMFIGSIVVNAQEKFDKAEKDLKSITDSVTTDNESAERIQKHDYKSTRIENDETNKEDEWEEWDDWDKWRDERKNEWKGSKKRGYFRGGAGGWDFYMMDLNVDNINTKLTGIGIAEFDRQIYMNGGGGWGFLGHGIRIGGLGAHGQVKSTGGSSVNGTRINKEVTLSINFGGFMIEKVYHPFNKTEFYFGTTIGGGNAQLKFDQWSGAADWNEIWDGYDNDVIENDSEKYTDYQNELSCGYYTVLPTIGFRYNIFRWAAVGVNAGYLYMRQNQDGWRMDGDPVSNAPEIDLSNVVYRLNFYFGG
ncbi:MAG: hypothetical protein JXR87_00930 [Candidatus Marinimicrobia bacterium]|nr:hypothetical protein [Candidatus Neomarinimicrobiota bacterium]